MTVLVVRRTPGRLAVRLTRPPVSGVVRPRAVAVCLVLLVVTAAAFAVGLSVGDYPVPLVDVLAALVDAGPPDAAFIVAELRLPRALTGVLVGVALGLSGAVTQGLARNPLASPDILGVTAGASLGAVAVIVLGAPAGVSTAAAALAGGLAAAVAVHLLVVRRRGTAARLVLVGIGISAVLSSLTSWLLVRADLVQAQQAFVWLTGSLNGRGWEHVRPVAVALAVLLPVLLLLARSAALLQHDDDTARGLGVSVGRARTGLVLVAVGLAALATAAAGPVAFVALVAPQVARRLAGVPGVPLLTSGLAGAALLAIGDLAARRVFAPTELPVGVVTAVVGAPVLLWLLARSNPIKGGAA